MCGPAGVRAVLGVEAEEGRPPPTRREAVQEYRLRVIGGQGPGGGLQNNGGENQAPCFPIPSACLF